MEKKKIDKIDVNRILYNAIQTPDGTIIESKHRHDFVAHVDKNGDRYSIDGGTEYLRRGFMKPDYTDISIRDDGSHETRRSHLRWGRNFDKNMNRLPDTEWILIQDMNTDHIEAIIDGGFAKNNKFYEDVFKEELKYRENEKKTV